VDGAQVGVLEQADQVGLSGLLQSQNSRALETQVALELLGDLADQALEGQLADQQVGALLELADLTQSHSTGAVAVGLLHAASSRGGLASGLGGQLLARGLASGGLAGGLSAAHQKRGHNHTQLSVRTQHMHLSRQPPKPRTHHDTSVFLPAWYEPWGRERRGGVGERVRTSGLIDKDWNGLNGAEHKCDTSLDLAF